MTRLVRVTLCPGAQARGDGIGASRHGCQHVTYTHTKRTVVKYTVVLMLLMMVFWQ